MVYSSPPPVLLLLLTIRFAHHRRRTIFVRLDADREIAQHIFVETFLSLDLVKCRGRSIDVKQRHVRFAVLANAVGEGLQAPILVLCDLATHLSDYPGQLRGQFLNLLRAQVLARKVDVFVQRHEMPFPC
jgi:hypothetical protein